MARTVMVAVDTKDMSRMARDLRRGTPELWPACHKALLAAALPVKRDAVARASWVKATPPDKPSHHSGVGVAASIHIRVTPGGAVEVVAGGAEAPEAAPIENKGRGFVRHKVFGHTDRWTAKHSHAAFLQPAFDRYEAAAMAAIEEAVVKATERAVRGI